MKLLIPALGRQRQMDLCEFEASLVYKGSFRTARTITQKVHISKYTHTHKHTHTHTNQRLLRGYHILAYRYF